MKRVLSLILVCFLLIATLPVANAAWFICSNCTTPIETTCLICGDLKCANCGYCPNCETHPYGDGTKVEYDSSADSSIGDNNGDGVPDNQEYYTVTVPAKMAPGDAGTVILSGAWASNRIVTVTAESSVTLVNSISASDQKILNVLFDGISKGGSNTVTQSFSQSISVADIEAALFGTWNGRFNYNVDATDYIDLNPDDGSTPADRDVYKAGDYIYTYRPVYSGWAVTLNTEVTDTKQTTYGPICESINGEPVTSLSSTFYECVNLTKSPVIPDTITDMGTTFFGCTSLVTAPVLPDSVTSMGWTFRECTNLKNVPSLPKNVTHIDSLFFRCYNLEKAPAIPDSVTAMDQVFAYCNSLTEAPIIPSTVTRLDSTFRECTSLTSAPAIPSSVISMKGTFKDCTGLTGEITINTNVTNNSYDYIECFNNVDFAAQNLKLVGSSTILDALGATGLNYCVDCDGVCTGNH